MTGPRAPVGHVYAIGLGSNRALSARLGPRRIVESACAALDEAPLRLLACSPIIATRPLGPSLRSYANAAALVATDLAPLAMLDLLQAIEHRFHRRRYRRWGPRTLDLDLLLWSGGRVASPRLTVPHPALPTRLFVLEPLCHIAPDWHHPGTGLTIRQMFSRLNRGRPVAPGRDGLPRTAG
ncbi:MAG TPA: 2-amino-4-hydroxy-6-hydroxymethyldihydropteridine diphosphokinase [Sphingobium sp.]|nr:2-amino-4-hydroxy-6-hydroxymethyldihydropteridine diphosphokinase [Sphingobium sp.]